MTLTTLFTFTRNYQAILKINSYLIMYPYGCITTVLYSFLRDLIGITV